MSPTSPRPRGPLSELVLDALSGPPRPLPVPDVDAVAHPLVDDDLHLALYCAYELHYRGLDGVDEDWEWHPELLAALRPLEQRFELALRHDVGPVPVVDSDHMPGALRQALAGDQGPSLSRYLAEQGSLDQLREFAVHRSAYQLKEADPHTWALPRFSGPVKSALVEIQSDEYGEGRPGEAHAELFARTMEALGLDATYGRYVDRLPGVTLATVNLITLFGLHRRLRGALVGHLAGFEMTSVVPMGRYASALRRFGVGGHEFYDVHVEADAHHEVVAAHDLAAGFARDEPDLAGEVLFGAQAMTRAERRFADHLLTRWGAGSTSLGEQRAS